MDTGLIIVTTILLLLCILPFYLMGRKNSEKKKQIRKHLNNFASKNACTIKQQDLWDDYAIAINQSNQMLLYSDRAEDGNAYRLFGLVGIRNCAVVKSENAHGGIKHISLKLQFANNADAVIEFYNENRHSVLQNELELANKWNAILNAVAK